MNDETKNTFDYIKEFMNTPLEQIYLNKKRIKLVLDYISNLQNENFKLKLQKDTNNCALAILNDKLQQELTDYKERNEKVSKIIGECLELFPHEFDWSEQMEHAKEILDKKDKGD